MDMEIITSAASTALANIVLAVIALAGAYAVYYIRPGSSSRTLSTTSSTSLQSRSMPWSRPRPRLSGTR